MCYSQKYCLVSFIKPIEAGTTFHMDDWPLHVTLADVFAIDMDQSRVVSEIENHVSLQAPISLTNGQEATLGTTDVTLFDPSDELMNLHTRIVDALEDNGAVFNDPEYTREGFLPHCTIQHGESLEAGVNTILNTLSIVDMFHGSDWQQRKVIKTLLFTH